MSNYYKFTCKIPGCKAYGKIVYADIEQTIGFLHKAHSHQELAKFAYENGLIDSVKGYLSHQWLLRKIAELCRLRDD